MDRAFQRDINRLLQGITDKKTGKLVKPGIMNNDRILESNKKYVKQFVSYLQAKGSAPPTIVKHLYSLQTFFDAIDPAIDLKNATREQIQEAFGKMEASGYSPETKHHFRVSVKLLYKQLFGEGYYYPKQVAWITSKKLKSKVQPSDILGEDEVYAMIEQASSIRDKAIISLLFDSGIRIGELLNLRKRDVDLNSNPAHVSVSGKTGIRPVALIFSPPYMGQYLDLTKLKQDDYLWKDIGSWSNLNRRPEAAAIRKMLRITASRAGISKRIYPHLFRHSRATFYAKKMTEQEMKIYFGWSGSSTMAGVYSHLSSKDADAAVLRANGVKLEEEQTKPKLSIKPCPRCKFSCGIDQAFCSRCGAALNIESAMQLDKDKQTMNNLMASYIQNPDKVVEEFVHQYLMKEYERKTKKKQ